MWRRLCVGFHGLQGMLWVSGSGSVDVEGICVCKFVDRFEECGGLEYEYVGLGMWIA